MPFALGIIGLLLIVSGARGTYPQLKGLLVEDFTGEGNFFYWIIAIGVVGSIGYVPGAEKFSRMFLALIILSMLIAQQRKGNLGGGFFTKFSDALKSVQPAADTQGNQSSAPGGSAVPGIPTPTLPGPAGQGLSEATKKLNSIIGTPPKPVTALSRFITGSGSFSDVIGSFF